jgi:hypothetical protein
LLQSLGSGCTLICTRNRMAIIPYRAQVPAKASLESAF